MHHVDTTELSCSTTLWYIPHTMHEFRLVETPSASQLEADLEVGSVQQLAENFISLCRQRIRYQTNNYGNVPDDNSQSIQAEEISISNVRIA